MENYQKLAHVYPLPRIGDMALHYEAVAIQGVIKMLNLTKDKLYINLL